MILIRFVLRHDAEENRVLRTRKLTSPAQSVRKQGAGVAEPSQTLPYEPLTFQNAALGERIMRHGAATLGSSVASNLFGLRAGLFCIGLGSI